MEAEVIITVCGLAVSVATFFIGRLTSARNGGQEYGVMLTEIGYIKSGVDDMKKKMEQSDRRYIDLAERVTSLEEAVRIYHHGE
ncbi:MAG: hypothetical protein J6L96_06765 [Clostridia bacterium]|nr:hypothetical protein [Clostridia bacterium]